MRLTSTDPERKILKTNENVVKLKSRQLSILGHMYYDSIAENIIEELPRHQLKISEMKKDGYQIVGYYRQNTCLQRMVNILYKRSLVDKVFVSPVSSAKQRSLKRDQEDKNSEIMSKLNNIHGYTTYFLEFLRNNTKVRVVVNDYASLTANMMDFKNCLIVAPGPKQRGR